LKPRRKKKVGEKKSDQERGPEKSSKNLDFFVVVRHRDYTGRAGMGGIEVVRVPFEKAVGEGKSTEFRPKRFAFYCGRTNQLG